MQRIQLRRAGFRADRLVEPIGGGWLGQPRFRLVESDAAANRAELVKIGDCPDFERVVVLKVTTLLQSFQPVR